MGKKKVKRELFFWIDKLQIDRRERISLAVTMGLIALLFITDVFINPKEVPAPENHQQILEEFERRSAIAKQKKKELEQRYNPETQLITENQASHIEPKTLDPVSINSGSLEELKELPGIGESYAQRIIEYRKNNGHFKSVEELIDVKGIGEKTLEKLLPLIKL